jgi:RimJ/RimL family protein N-acetyltransferase
VGPWVCEKAGGTWVAGRGTAIGWDRGGLVAGVLYEDWNGANVLCHIRAEGTLANRHFLGVIFDYPFNQLGVRRITVPIASDNAPCIRMVTNMGFRLEATLKHAAPNGDLLLYRLFRDECKFIKGRYALPPRHS